MTFITIKKRKDFLVAFNSGKKFITGSFILQMVKRAEAHIVPAGEVRVGFTVTKKMGNAVIRNRIKRRLREAVRHALAKRGIAGHDYVIISRHKALTCDFADLTRDMEYAFRKILTHSANDKKK
jgi:ribonuclease P protein component